MAFLTGKAKALGEVAIRCSNVRDMARFYEDVVGLRRLEGNHRQELVFFRIADGHAGHTAILALFPGQDGADANSSLHHFALTVDRADQDEITDYFDRIGQAYRIEEFAWVNWRGVFTADPEGNTVEFVAYDPSVSVDGI